MISVQAYQSDDGRLFLSPEEAVARDKLLADQAATATAIRKIEATIPTFTAEQAIEKMDAGTWMTSGGYTLRNITCTRWGPYFGRKGGEYWAYGEYPGCVRSGPPQDLHQVRSMSAVWREKFGPDGKIQWPVEVNP